ncbi:hypothetical protein EB796_003257 [Bugula neritina]|uniref:WAP domain-containing protein n=1 Tax=Bugula neritina TaxID=10212 RepID=A0A7J7KKB3_BUGNE|nr:hypothetical protein EB796_003257 [Bugula neritina]
MKFTIFTLLVFAFVCLYTSKAGLVGVCPPPGEFGICLQECTSHFQCSGGQLCCYNGCGRTCTPPDAIYKR